MATQGVPAREVPADQTTGRHVWHPRALHAGPSSLLHLVIFLASPAARWREGPHEEQLEHSQEGTGGGALVLNGRGEEIVARVFHKIHGVLGGNDTLAQ